MEISRDARTCRLGRDNTQRMRMGGDEVLFWLGTLLAATAERHLNSIPF